MFHNAKLPDSQIHGRRDPIDYSKALPLSPTLSLEQQLFATCVPDEPEQRRVVSAIAAWRPLQLLQLHSLLSQLVFARSMHACTMQIDTKTWTHTRTHIDRQTET